MNLDGSINSGKKTKKYLIMDSQGQDIQFTGLADLAGQFSFNPAFEKLLIPIAGGTQTSQPTETTSLFKRWQWLKREPGSDAGHFRFYPKGTLVFSLLSDWIESLAQKMFGSLAIRTPLIYDWTRAEIQEQAGLFGPEIYRVSIPTKDRSYVLRFNDDVGVFELLKDSQLTYKHLPLRLHEPTLAFRYTASGQLAGIKRARAFTVTDMHSFCADQPMVYEEYFWLFGQHLKIAQQLNLGLAVHYKVPENFYSVSRKHILKLTRLHREPALIELLPAQKQYWSMKHICYTDHPLKLFHLQLDFEDGLRYGISYTDANGVQQPAMIVHNSMATIERWMLVYLSEALKKPQPVLPLWLAPVQVRIIPVDEEKHLNSCSVIADQLNQARIRAEIDDRKKTVSWKIRTAEQDWVPIIIVIGDKEKNSQLLPLRIRNNGKFSWNLAELINHVHHETAGFPFRALNRPLISTQLRFRD